MGNKPSGNSNSSNKTTSKGQALGSSSTAPKPHNQGNSDQENARIARTNLIHTKKNFKNKTQLQKKQTILNIMEQADAVQAGKVPPITYSSDTNENKKYSNSSKITSMNSLSNNKNPNESKSIYMADPSSKQALAAQQRMQAKSRTNKSSSAQERKNRTAQLLFGDGLNIDSTIDEIRNSPKIKATVVLPSKSSSKSITSLVKNDSQAANAAMKRLNMNQSKKLSTNERKARTMQLMHGDLLKTDEVSIPKERKSDGGHISDGVQSEVRDVHQSLLNLQNCNPHLKMPATAKLLRKIISNILQAESIEDQKKYGKIRLTQKKIKSAIVDMKYGVQLLKDLGFEKKEIVNEKSGMMDEYMVYDFGNANQKAIWHVMELLDEHYPENV